jgi:prepilin-type N-terminal cleavage/methylation domain-containing protein
MKKQRGYTLRELLLVIGVLALVLGGGGFWLFGDSDGALLFSGAMKEKVTPTAEYALETSGTNVRVYEWTTKSGMACAAIFSKKAAIGDCEFPPAK